MVQSVTIVLVYCYFFIIKSDRFCMNKKRIIFFLLGIFFAFHHMQGASETPSDTLVKLSHNLSCTIIHDRPFIETVRAVFADPHFTIAGKKLVLKKLLVNVYNLNDYEGGEPLILGAIRSSGCGFGCFELLTLLKERGALIDAQSSANGHTALHFACAKKISMQLVQFLVEKCSANLNILDHANKTPLDYVLATKQAKASQIIEWLQAKGAKTSQELLALQQQQEEEVEESVELPVSTPPRLLVLEHQDFIAQLNAPVAFAEELVLGDLSSLFPEAFLGGV